MNILIATKNKDKFNIISKMIASIIDDSVVFKSLNDFDNYIESEECGNNVDRAKQKALDASSNIKEKFDYILGIDDGIIINNQEYAAVKEHLQDIVVGDEVPIGSTIYITRAYYLISNGKEKYCYNKIPYIIKKKLSDYRHEGYPLNDVLSTIDNDEVLSNRDKDELNEYFLKYSINDLKKILEWSD